MIKTLLKLVGVGRTALVRDEWGSETDRPPGDDYVKKLKVGDVAFLRLPRQYTTDPRDIKYTQEAGEIMWISYNGRRVNIKFPMDRKPQMFHTRQLSTTPAPLDQLFAFVA